MDYSKVDFGTHKKIMVIGPQRSGTTILSKIIANDLNIKLIDESEYNVNDVTKLMEVTGSLDGFVIQAPALTGYVFELPQDWLYVLSVRGIAEIMSSEFRIRWLQEGQEKANLMATYKQPIFATLPSCIQKYIRWLTDVKPKMTNTLEIEYDSLKGHSFWVDKEDRKSFEYKQTELKEL